MMRRRMGSGVLATGRAQQTKKEGEEDDGD